MAWTPPSSLTTGTLVTADTWNQNLGLTGNSKALRDGGIAIASQAIGDIMYASSTTQLGRIVAVATGQILTSAGTGTVPAWSSNVDLGGTLDVTGATTLDSTLAAKGVVTITNTASGQTASSNSRLVIDHNDNTAVNILSGTGGGGFIDFGDSGDADIGRIAYIHTSNYMAFTTNAAERMRIDSAGNVGIGGSPNTAYQLHVTGWSAQDASPVRFDMDVAGTGIAEADGIVMHNDDQGTASESYLRVDFTNTSDTTIRGGAIGFKKEGSWTSTAATNDSLFAVGTALNGTVTEKMRITSAGNVGVGVTDPGVKLEISGDCASYAENNAQVQIIGATDKNMQLRMGYRTDTTNGYGWLQAVRAGTDQVPFIIQAEGNTVGIGAVTAPLAKLHVKTGDSGLSSLNAAADDLFIESSAGAGITLAGGADQNGMVIFGDPDSNYQGLLIYDHSSSVMKFGTSGSVQMVIDLDGDVGIGVTDPDVALDVSGKDNVLDIFRITQRVSGAAAYGLQVGLADTGDPVFQRLVNDTATESFRIVRGTGVVKFNANVGIGTSTPTSPSDVARILEIEDGTHAGLVLHDSTADAWEIYANGHDMSFSYDNSIKMRIEGDTGYVGMGTTEITNPLTVSAGGGQGIKVDTSPGTSGAAGATGGSAFLTLGSHTGTTNNNNLDNSINFMVDNVTKWSWGMKGQGSTDATADMTLFNNVHDNVCIKVFGASNTVNFIDAVNVAGAFSKGSGSFKIDHPLPSMKDTNHLIHSFIEGPKADLIYRGSITLVEGTAEVDLDDAAGMTSGTWILLCRDEQCYTSNETGWKHVRGSVTGSTLTIDCEESDCTDTVSWMVVACRQDDHMKSSHTLWTDDDGYPIIEPLKPEPEENE